MTLRLNDADKAPNLPVAQHYPDERRPVGSASEPGAKPSRCAALSRLGAPVLPFDVLTQHPGR